MKDRIPVLYLAPWVDYGGSDKGTIDWFRWLDRDRFAPSLITTQPSDNRRLREVFPFAEEVWALPQHMSGHQFSRFIFDFVHTRGVRVLHVMNSRLAYELLPDLAALEAPPAVVVQLHVEEEDRSGYVRYVTSRYGNLVDAFSVTSEHLAAAVKGYDVAGSKIHVIPTGVDAEHEFNPELIRPIDHGDEQGLVRVLFAGRLVEQKNPRLMVEVAARAIARNDRIRIDVVGDGPLESAVRSRINEKGLESRVRFHPPSAELARWLAASDLVLMTSAFEGVPYLIYEALAMGVPVVVPALPGNVEVMRDTGGVLVDERDDPDAYADAICRLAESDDLRARMGSSGRSRMLEQFSLRAMAARHEEIYSDLLVHRQVTALPDHPPLPAPLRLCNRPVTGTPLVSVVTPCFNHGRYLSSYLEAIRGQDYPEIEVIIVDDASTDPETVAVLRQIEQDGDARVIWQEANRGPSAARNRAIDAANGRYVLPVDSDNILLEGSVRSLVEQLQTAGEQIGFIYPGFEYFGTRDYRYQPPAYNLFRLLQGNYVDTCSLLDREIFDAGFRYGEDIELGHEDWDLALALGAREVYGQPSRMPVMRYRKQGFTRSDAVEYLRLPFYEEIQERRPELFGFARDIGSWGRYSGPAIKIKARWNPALSLIATGPVDFASEEGIGLVEALQRQSCADFELLVECELAPRLDSPVVRRIPPGLATSVVGRLEEALVLARGRYVMAARNPLEVLSDPTTVEKLTRAFGIDQRLDAVALADLGPSPSNFPFRLVDEVPQNAIAHAVAWRRRGREFGGLTICGPVETHSVATELHRAGATMYWRHFPSHGSQLLEAAADVEPGGVLDVVDARPRAGDRPTRLEADQRLDVAPAIPAMPHDQVIRWTWSPAWMPPETVPLVRHVHVDGSHRIITTDRTPPADYKIEFDLGSIQRFAPPGTIRLVRRGGAFLTAPRGSERRDDDQELGHLEEAPLPLFVAIERATLADGSETLVLASDRDPTRALARELTFLGFIEGYPNEPVARPAYTKVSTDVAAGQAVLVRVLDYQSRRHRYRTAASYEQPVGAGEVATPLGRLSTVQTRGAIAVRIDGRGRIATDRYSSTRSSPDVRELAKWSLAPVRWRGFGHRYGRARAVVRRGGDSARLAAGAVTHLGPGRAARPSEWLQVGFLYEDSAPGRTELFAATHPVLDDQFVTDRPSQASDMGYRDVQSIGYADEVAPSTRALANDRVAIPWASRFGLLTRG